MPSANNKRIAKNTLLLYFRMLLTMMVSLFTVRIVLNTLGVTDYGIYNVVGGIVIMFSFLSNSLASASQRFFSYELGKNNLVQLKNVFSITVTIYAILAVIIFILAETIGLWLLNNYLTIPDSRIEASNWVYQFSIFAFIVTIMAVPYNAAIIAHENMKVYAYLSLIEVILKLVIVYILVLFSFDKLKVYALLTFLITLIIRYIYTTICRKKYIECQYFFYWNKDLFKEILNFSGWNLIGVLASVMNNYGINILLNIFFNPAINAARAVAYKINSTINQFVTNFITAVRPQIVKQYANGEKEEMLKLVFRSSKYSYLLLLLISMPALLETNFILKLWLKQVPEYTIIFTRLVILSALIDSLSYPLTTAAMATGKIKHYQIVVGGALLLNLPISYLFLMFGYPPQITLYISLIVSCICLFLRIWFLKKMIGLSISTYIKQVILKCQIVTISAYIIPFLLLISMDENLSRFFLVLSTGLITTTIATIFIGLISIERKYLFQFANSKMNIFLSYLRP